MKLINNQYKEVRVLGQGGFGKTILVEDSLNNNKRYVAKQFNPTALNNSESAITLFKSESQHLESLNSIEGIPNYIEYIEWENKLYIIQEYITGQNLKEDLASKGQV